MSDQTEKRLTWLALVYDSALKHGVFRPADVIVHATPEVIAKDLPKEASPPGFRSFVSGLLYICH